MAADDMNGSSGSGTDALAGLDYQIDISIWLALDLVLANRLTDAIELEPASQEDLEADLAAEEPGPVVSQAVLSAAGPPYRLVVQAKLRSGDPWSVQDVNRLLEHGKRRVSVADRLKDSDVRYLLVTSAALSGGATSLRTHSPTVWPQEALPATTGRLLPDDAPGRLAILSNQEPAWVLRHIKALLTESLRVPYAAREACLDALRAGARSRVRRLGTNLWTRQDLDAIVIAHDGYLASAPQLDDYVLPTNWDALRRQIAQRHAVLIIGQSGTGKTLATDKLYDELSGEIPGLRRVRIRTPEELRQYSLPGPVIFDIEDPWGRYTYEQASRGWLPQIQSFMADARPDRLVVATSRLDVGTEAKVLEKLQPWIFPLEAEHYGTRERRALYGRRIDRLKQTVLRQLALANIQPVLAALSTPLQIQKFFDALRMADLDAVRRNPAGVVQACVTRAHEDSIEVNIAEQIEARHDVKAAAVLWGLLLDRQSASFEDLLIVEDALYRLDDRMENGITPLAHFLVAARNLRQKDNLLSIYHGRDEKGLLKAIQARPLPVRATLARLVEILATRKLGDGKVHIERAAMLADACRREAGLPLSLGAEAQNAIDSWLSQVMAVPGHDLERQLRLAASIGSKDNIEAEVARWLDHRPRRRQFEFMVDWGAPRWGSSWRDRIRGASATRPLIERFIREVLSVSRDSYGPSFVRGARLLAGDVTQAFIDGAYRAVEYGILRSEGTIFRGAFADLEGCAPVVEHAIEMLTPTPEEEAKAAVTRLAVDNDEYSPGYLESFADNDDGYTARAFLESYVIELRERRGWTALRDHRRVRDLLDPWLRHLRRGKVAVSIEELEGLLPLVEGGEHEADYWAVAHENWEQPLETALVDRIISGSPRVQTRTSAATCLLAHARHHIPSIVNRLRAAGARGRMADLALELAGPAATMGPSPQPGDPLDPLPEPYRTIAHLEQIADVDRTPPAHEQAAAIAALPAESEEFRAFRVSIADTVQGTAVRGDVVWILAHSDEVDRAVSAIECAIARDWRDIVRDALEHRFARVAAAAMRALAAPPPGPLPPELLAMIAKSGRAVKETLVELIAQRRAPTHFDTLLALTEDRLSNADTHDEDNSLPIARRAVDVLTQYAFADPAALDRLRATAIATDDFTLRRKILALLAARGEPGQRLLLHLVLSEEKAGPRIAAVSALVDAAEQLAAAIVAAISSEIVLRLHPRLAAQLALIVAWRGSREQVDALANALSATPRRRVFLALVAAGRLHRDPGQAAQVAAHLPDGHIAKRWALGEDIGKQSDEVLNDLGSVAAVTEVLPYLGHRNTAAGQEAHAGKEAKR